MVGIRGIRNLLFSIGTMQSLGDSTEEKKALWAHSYQVAFYSYNLSRNFCASRRDLIEDSYVCGLLHDIGKIVFDTAHPDILDHLDPLCEKHQIPKQLLEKITAGANHSEIGALIAAKWNLPDVIVETIRYHHRPEDAPENYRRLTEIVFMADLLIYYQQGKVLYDQFDQDILAAFGITSESQLSQISEKLAKAFENDTIR
jgi:putative nucleotidyltransferase with HDIG domain